MSVADEILAFLDGRDDAFGRISDLAVELLREADAELREDYPGYRTPTPDDDVHTLVLHCLLKLRAADEASVTEEGAETSRAATAEQLTQAGLHPCAGGCGAWISGERETCTDCTDCDAIAARQAERLGAKR